MLKPGIIIGEKYEIKQLLAYGGMAEVYLGSNISGSKKVAIKRLIPWAVQDTNYLELFFNEANILKKLSHINIITYIDFFSENNNYYIITEFIIGKDLGLLTNYFAKQKLSSRESLSIAIMIQLCEALEDIHRKNIIHNDISLSNIMIDINGLVKLIDFGIAKILDNNINNFTNLVQGKIGFFSPEMILGKELSIKSDIFSLGLTFLFLLQNKKIFLYKSDQQIISIISQGELQKLININNIGLKKIILKMTEYSPDNRYNNCLEIVDDLKKYSKIRSLPKAKKYIKNFVDKTDYINIKIINYYHISYSLISGVFILVIFILAKFLYNNKIFLNFDTGSSSGALSNLNYQNKENTITKSESTNSLTDKGYLLVEAYPWAYVYIDDQLLGQTPLNKIALFPGEYLIKLENPDLRAIQIKLVRIISQKTSLVKTTFGNR